MEQKTITDLEKQTRKQPPKFRVVQSVVGRDNTIELREVGAMWEYRSKKNSIFYVLNIGKLRLLVFPNEKA